MSILKNFINPWESTGELGSQAVSKTVLSENILSGTVAEEAGSTLNPYRGYCFDEKGLLVARFKYKKPSGGVFVILRSRLKSFTTKKGEAKADRSKRYFAYIRRYQLKMSIFYYEHQFDKKLFPASSISKIYTQILEDFNYDLTKLQNGELSVYGSQRYQYNDANPWSGVMGTTYKGLNTPAKFRITVGTGRLNEVDTVAGTVNILGAHEYEGHGIKGFSDNHDTHYKVYEYQMTHESWSYLTITEVDALVASYVFYVRRELSGKRILFWEKIKAIELEYGNKKLYPQVNIELKGIYVKNGK